MTSTDPDSPPLRDSASNLLSADAATIRRAAFHRLRTGACASVADLVADTGLADDAVLVALDALVVAGTATLNEIGEVLAVGGLSIAPAAHDLLMDGRAFWTWCAFDGIGIPAALGLDALARTRCGHCGTRLDIPIAGGAPPADSPVVGWLPGQSCTNVQLDFCPAANLFCTPQHLANWRTRAGDPPGQSATLTGLAELGAQVWAEMRTTGGHG